MNRTVFVMFLGISMVCVLAHPVMAQYQSACPSLCGSSGWSGCLETLQQRFSPGSLVSQSYFCDWELTFQNDLASQYIWRGMDRLIKAGPNNTFIDDDFTWTWQPMLDLNMGATGLGTSIWGNWPFEKGYVNTYELNYSVYFIKPFMYDNFLFSTSWTYHDFYRRSTKPNDFNNFQYGLVWSAYCLQPFFNHHIIVPMDSSIGIDGGNQFQLGLSYTAPLAWTPTWDPTGSPIPLTWMADIWYDDGTFGRDPGLAFSTLGLEADIPLCGGIMFSPALYYQFTYDNTVNPNWSDPTKKKNEFWTVMRLSYTLPLLACR